MWFRFLQKNASETLMLVESFYFGITVPKITYNRQCWGSYIKIVTCYSYLMPKVTCYSYKVTFY